MSLDLRKNELFNLLKFSWTIASRSSLPKSSTVPLEYLSWSLKQYFLPVWTLTLPQASRSSLPKSTTGTVLLEYLSWSLKQQFLPVWTLTLPQTTLVNERTAVDLTIRISCPSRKIDKSIFLSLMSNWAKNETIFVLSSDILLNRFIWFFHRLPKLEISHIKNFPYKIL